MNTESNEPREQFARPEVEDLGDLNDLTEGTALRGAEDGGLKLDPVPHHSLPTGP